MTTIFGLDGIEREWAEVFAGDAAHKHGLNELAGYVVRRTSFDGAAHVDIAQIDDAFEYATATKIAHETRADIADGYAVVDQLYACGCRGAA